MIRLPQRLPDPNVQMVLGDGRIALPWYQYFREQDVALRALIAIANGETPLNSYAVANVPAAADNEGALIYVSDEAGGAVPAFSDGTDWRRVTDRNVIS